MLPPPMEDPEGRPDYSEQAAPHELKTEKAVLAAILIDPGAVLTVMQYLQPEDFYDPKHQRVCAAAYQLANDNRVIDTITLAEALSQRQDLHKVGGEMFLTELFDSAVSAAAVEHHAQIVLEHSRLRKLKHVEALIADGIQSRKPADDVMGEAEAAIFALGVSRSKADYESLADVMPRVVDSIDERISNKRTVVGIPTGFIEMDRLTQGFHRDEFAVIAARPGVGKTAFALNIAEAACKANYAVAIVSLEMKKETLIERALAGRSRTDAQRLRAGFLSPGETGAIVQASSELAAWDVRIDDDRDQNVFQIRSKARRAMMQRPYDLLIVDYLQNVQSSGKLDNRSQEVTLICRSLRALAKELHVAVVTLSQILRSGKGMERKRPMLSELKESGGIEEVADLVFFIHRPELAETTLVKQLEYAGLAECIVAKQRNGPLGFFNLKFVKEHVRFENLAEDAQEEAPF